MFTSLFIQQTRFNVERKTRTKTGRQRLGQNRQGGNEDNRPDEINRRMPTSDQKLASLLDARTKEHLGGGQGSPGADP